MQGDLLKAGIHGYTDLQSDGETELPADFNRTSSLISSAAQKEKGGKRKEVNQRKKSVSGRHGGAVSCLPSSASWCTLKLALVESQNLTV